MGQLLIIWVVFCMVMVVSANIHLPEKKVKSGHIAAGRLRDIREIDKKEYAAERPIARSFSSQEIVERAVGTVNKKLENYFALKDSEYSPMYQYFASINQ